MAMTFRQLDRRAKLLGKPVETPGRHAGLTGQRHISDVVLVDQSPIGKTSRSVPATFAV